MAKERPAPDQLLVDIARYARRDDVAADVHDIARACMFDSIGCALMALSVPDCTRLLGPIVPGTIVPNGARVIGTGDVLDPVKAAFDTGCLLRWLDFNDSAPTGGHPSDNTGMVLPVADYVSRKNLATGKPGLVMDDVLTSIVKTYEINGVISAGNVFDRPGVGLDSVVMVKVASTAVAAHLLGGTEEQIVNAVSNAFADGQALNLYRKVPNAGTRKSWAAGDADSRAVRFALMAVGGEMGYPTVLTAKNWGFYTVSYRGEPLVIPRPFGSHTIRNIQFKISYPTQRHGQTAAECAVTLHPQVKNRLAEIDRVVVQTHERAMKTISVQGPLTTVAARDHCLEYILAVGLIFGDVTSASYRDDFAADPRIDQLRDRIKVEVNEVYTRGYNDPETWSDANAVQVFFKDGRSTHLVERQFSLGHPRRRSEGLPLIRQKFEDSARKKWPERVGRMLELFDDIDKLRKTPVVDFISLFVP